MPRKFYFAYGSNLDFDQMSFRCPGAVYIGTATLPNHRFTMDSAGYATVVPQKGSHVQGALWDLDNADESKMDYYEGVEFGYYTKEWVSLTYDGDLRDDEDRSFVVAYGTNVNEAKGCTVDALIYLSARPPFVDYTFRYYYVKRILNGARRLKLDPAHIKSIEDIEIVNTESIPKLNRDRVVDFLHSGCKKTARNLGVEVEHFVVHGPEAAVYGRLVTEWASTLFGIAKAALPESEHVFLNHLEAFSQRGCWND